MVSMEVSVSRNSHFNAAHRLHLAHWSDEKNKAVFGLCNNPSYHGHNYNLTVTVTGPLDEETGFVIDTKVLKEIIREEIEDRFDHKNLNLDVPEFEKLNPTAENIAIIIWRLISKRLDKHLKLSVKLYETERNFVEYSGNE
jgi:6-pyruvoyltetrahydropterin/6-carboxytetrahydropterin synthase